eukprot:127362-Chlamydomonas_euryale.AAC.6
MLAWLNGRGHVSTCHAYPPSRTSHVPAVHVTSLKRDSKSNTHAIATPIENPFRMHAHFVG